MIRVAKSNKVPESLLKTNSYDGEDVKQQLFHDQHNKCYLCERKVTTDFQIEHFKSQENYPKLRTEWTNLLLSCDYCNQKKGSRYDDILNPLDCNIEDIIEQSLDYSTNKAEFRSEIDSEQVRNTIALLNTIFNGSSMLRKFKEAKFFEEIEGLLNRFVQKVNVYKLSHSLFAEESIRQELSIDEELLGFKYWIIKKDDELSATFANDIVWNKIA
ncbi:MAG: HNH endonuclease [Bacteroidales bacterium]|nr:HNH endonuclease [Bacteroidales bacterium]